MMNLVVIVFAIVAIIASETGVAQATAIPTTFPTASPSQANWQTTPLPFKLDDPLNGKRIVSGYNGQNVAIATPYGIYASTDYGNSFFWTNAPMGYWSTVVSDSSGNNMYALNSAGEIYYSYGALKTGWVELPYTFTPYVDISTDSSGSHLYGIETYSNTYCCYIDIYKNQYYYNGAYIYYLNDVCNKIIVDSSNTYVLVMTASANQIALSTNSGSTFTVYNLPFALTSFYPMVTTSYYNSNNYVYIANGGQLVEISTDQGVSFSASTTVNTNFINATMIASSGTGQTVVFGGFTDTNTNNAEIWISSSYGSTFTTAFPTTAQSIVGGFISSSGTSIYVLAAQYLYSYQQCKYNAMI